MNFLQYKSDEMFSSTQLIRKSKMIFDKLSNDEIEKAVVLRDGKPSFLLMDFEKYEKIMLEYTQLKAKSESSQATLESKSNTTVKKDYTKTPIESQEESNAYINTETTSPTKPKLTEKEQADLDKALKELESLDMEAATKKREELKEFWD